MLATKGKGRTTRAGGFALLLAAVLMLPATPVSGMQVDLPEPVVSGTVSNAATGEPIAGALVRLLDPDGEQVRSHLTGSDGRFSFRAPSPGTWTVAVTRLGFDETRSEPLELSEGELRTLELTIASAPIALEAVDVAAAAAALCRRLDPEEGSLLARLWQEARSALLVLAWAEAEERYEFQMVRWERSIDLMADRVEEESRGAEVRSLHPFETAPVAELLAEGWIRPAEATGVYDYYGLDAATLLSHEFQDAHCFEIRVDPEATDRVGLAFEPVRRVDRPGVRGVLWLDRETAALEQLVFEYTFHPHEPPIPPELFSIFNGEVEFRELPDGGWVVDRWTLRMPQYRLQSGSGYRSIAGIERGFTGRFSDVVDELPSWWRDLVRDVGFGSVEEGGELLGIRTPAGEYLPARARAALEGVVTDSTRARGLEGAEVHLVGTDHTARTDRRGAFLLEVPLDGNYLVNFTHPRLDSLGIEALPAGEVSLRRGETARIELGVPTERTLVALACEREPGVGSEGILWGRVLEPTLEDPLAGVSVYLRPEVEGDPEAGDPEVGVPVQLQTVTDADGRYRFCSVPPDLRYRAEAELLGVQGQGRGVRLAPGAVVSMDLSIRMGTVGELRGVVREGETGPPVPQATVIARGPGEARTVTTDAEGRFVLSELPSGSYELQVNHVAFRTLDADVEVEGAGRTTQVTVRLLRDAIALDPIQVEVEARPTWGPLADVYDRREQMERLGIGNFFDRRQIENAGTNRVSSLVARLPGVRTVPVAGRGAGTSELRVHRTRDCAPSLYVDGQRMMINPSGDTGLEDADGMTETIDDLMPLSWIEMIEVYRSLAQLPGEFADDNARACGAIAVWTRRGH